MAPVSELFATHFYFEFCLGLALADIFRPGK